MADDGFNTNYSCWNCCPNGYDPVSNCSRTFTEVALYTTEAGQVVGLVFLALFSYLLIANAHEMVRIWGILRTTRHTSVGMLTVFGLGALHALSRVFISCTMYERYFLLVPGTPTFPESVKAISEVMYVVGMQAMLSEVAFAILAQLRLLRAIQNPFKRHGSPFVQMAALGVFFGSAMLSGSVLLRIDEGDYWTLGTTIFNVSMCTQIMILTYLIHFFGRALERALLMIDRTGSMQVDAYMRGVMNQHRRTIAPVGVLATLDIIVVLVLLRMPVTPATRTALAYVIVILPLALEVIINWVILNSFKKLARRHVHVSPDTSTLKSATVASAATTRNATSSNAPALATASKLATP
jgi:hypothetical protein